MKYDKLLNNLKQECLVVDIETWAVDILGNEININAQNDYYIEKAVVKWFGAYSYREDKLYLLNPVYDEDKIKKLLATHSIIVGFNSEEFDFPILANNRLTDIYKRYIQVDCMQILGKSNFKNKSGYLYKNRGTLMNYKFKNNSLKTMAIEMGLKTQKKELDYHIFAKDAWTQEEEQKIKFYLQSDVVATSEIFDKLWDFWKPFTEMLDEKYVTNLSWIRNSIASLTYKCACSYLGIEPTYSDRPSKAEEMGGRVILPKYQEARNVWYIDYASLYPHIICMFNLLDENISTINEFNFSGNDIFKVRGKYYAKTPHKLNAHIQKCLKERIKLKKTDPDNPMIYTLKIFLNGLYGVIRSGIFEQLHTPNAGWDTCWLGQQISMLTEKIMDEFGFETIAGDSISGDSKIITYNKQIAIEELWNLNKNNIIYARGKEIKKWSGDKILTCDNNFNNIYLYPVEIIRHKVNKKIYKISLSKQDSLILTEDEGLLCLDENLQYMTVSPKDILEKKINYVLFNRYIPRTKIVSKKFQKELYNLMGMIVANGSIEPYCISISYEYINEYIDKIISKINKPFKIQFRDKKTDIRLASKKFRDLFANLGFAGNSKTKRLPTWLFDESEENICYFLNGIMSGDGTVCLRNNKPIIRYTSINEKLIDDLRFLFALVGIASSKIKETTENNYKGKKSGTYSYHLIILDRERYKNKVGFICDTKNNRIKNESMKQWVNASINDFKHAHNKAKSTLRIMNDIYNRGFIPRRINKIEEIKYTDYVYDISIPGTQKFYANNVLVHNTDSLFLLAKDKKYNNKEYVKDCLKKVIKKINDNCPFPVETFNIDIEDYLDYIMFPFSNQEVVDEKTRQLLNTGIINGYQKQDLNGRKCIIEIASGKIVKRGRSWVKEPKGKKKNYLYICGNDVTLVGLPIKKDGATHLGIKIYEEILKPLIIKNKSAKFNKKFMDDIVNDYLKKDSIMKLISREFKVKPYTSYKVSKGQSEPTGIYAQISKQYFNGREGIINLIKNKKIGKVGRGYLYCTVEEAIQNNLNAKDLDLEKLWGELEPFIKE